MTHKKLFLSLKTSFPGLALGCLVLGFSGPGHAAKGSPADIVFKGAPVWKDPKTGDSFKIRGRIYYDGAYIKDNIKARDSVWKTELRTARLGVEGRIQAFKYKAEFDFAPDDVTAKDVYLEYVAKKFSVILGQHKTPNSLGELTSSRYTTFMERGMMTDLVALSRRLGVSVKTSGERYSFRAGVFGRTINDKSREKDPFIAAARLTYAPLYEKGKKALHLGAHIRYYHAKDRPHKLQVRPNTHQADKIIKIKGGLGDTSTLYGLEAAWVNGPFHVEAEGMIETGDHDRRAAGGYVQAGYFLTGEVRPYSPRKGVFGRVKPLHPLHEGGRGALEIAARYDHVSVSKTIGASLTTGTVGLNWYPEPYVRFMVNYVYGKGSPAGSSRSDDFHAFQLRAQIDW